MVTPKHHRTSTMWGASRLRDTVARQQWEKLLLTARRKNSFFDHLHRDVRNMMYGYMTLGAIRNKDAKPWIGLRGACRQAKAETEEEGVRHLWLYVGNLRRTWETRGNYIFERPRSMQTATTFAGVQQLTLFTDGTLGGNCVSCTIGLWFLLRLAIKTIRIHFSGSVYPGEIGLQEAFHTLSCLTLGLDKQFFTNNIVISWDFRAGERQPRLLDGQLVESQATVTHANSPRLVYVSGPGSEDSVGLVRFEGPTTPPTDPRVLRDLLTQVRDSRLAHEIARTPWQELYEGVDGK